MQVPQQTKRRPALLLGPALLALFGSATAFAEVPVLDSSPLALPFESTVVVTGREASCAFALQELNEIVKKATGKAFRLPAPDGTVVPAPVRESVDGTVKRRIFIGRYRRFFGRPHDLVSPERSFRLLHDRFGRL